MRAGQELLDLGSQKAAVVGMRGQNLMAISRKDMI